ncbi:Ribosomal-protein-S5p-alanine acetyltransferase [Collimonas arenae]|uniref:Ribosomal-protein-S5p-alanine acetyltransferase n=1 Tax=Collimonas arenae TaxID=279058 RepID=A0A0A1FFI7_9BURK|nr:GNAT family N-acetyltransferase [Collimonas arenae]AIY43246.1 Ribosomal-protein-S5p-alanine acetyltransferase [Collimonas arenae]
MKNFKLRTDRLELQLLSLDRVDAVAEYHIKNREHLAPWEPLRDDDYFDVQQCSERIKNAHANHELGTALHFIVSEIGSDRMIGACNFTNIVKGPFMACNLGYSLAHDAQGKGYMQEALHMAIRHVFESVGLHRIMANHLPGNLRSEKLLHGLGFEKEGYAKSYLRIAGKWQDHVLNSLVNPADKMP